MAVPHKHTCPNDWRAPRDVALSRLLSLVVGAALDCGPLEAAGAQGDHAPGSPGYEEPTPQPGSGSDVWIKDCEADDGSTPSRCSEWWTSPDIYVDNNNNGIPDGPLYGESNLLKANVRNGGDGWAVDVTVQFYFRDASSDSLAPSGAAQLDSAKLVFPDGATLIGSTYGVSIPPHESASATTVWVVPRGWRRFGQRGRWHVGVRVDNGPDDEPIHPPPLASMDQNVGVASLSFMVQQGGRYQALDFMTEFLSYWWVLLLLVPFVVLASVALCLLARPRAGPTR